MTRFRATTATVISFFITESPTVRGPVGDMKDERHMLSGEGMDASSPRFKSKRRLERTDIFKGVEEKRGRTTLDEISEIEEASSEIEEANSKIEEALAFSKARLAQKPRANLLFQICPHLSHATSTLDGVQNSKRRAQNSKRQAQKSERHLFF
ncbi:hypothetical protein ACFX1R_039816 [Malus domestica]